MLRDLKRYLSSGQPIDIIYMDQSAQITQRRIKLHSIQGEQVKAYCFTRQSVRSFKAANILAVTSAGLMKGA